MSDELTVVSPDVEELSRDERLAEAYRLKLAGEKPTEIATRFDVSERTVFRWLRRFEELIRRDLEVSEQIQLIAREVGRLNDLEDKARAEAEQAKSPRDRASFQNIALRAAKQRQFFLLECGVLTRDPARIFSAAVSLKPEEVLPATSGPSRSKEAIAAEIEKLAGRYMPVGSEPSDPA
jgi:hypothetical protein